MAKQFPDRRQSRELHFPVTDDKFRAPLSREFWEKHSRYEEFLVLQDYLGPKN